MPTLESTDIVIVLAAGRGTRMGGPKALMDVSGRAWWRTQQERIGRTGLSELWVVSDAVAADFARHTDAPRTALSDPDAPMFASIAAGLALAASDPPGGVLVLPVDVPMCAPTTVHALREIPDRPAIPVHSATRGHPVRLPWAFIASAIAPHLADPAWIAAARLDDLIRASAVEVVVDDGAVATNLNTPQDVARWTDASRS